MGSIASKVTACLPISSAVGILPQEYVNDSMEMLIGNYDSQIIHLEEKSETLVNEAATLRRRGKNKEALYKFKQAKGIQAKITKYEQQKQTIESQLDISQDKNLTIETMKVLKEHTKLLKERFGADVVEEAEKIMQNIREQQEDVESIQLTLAEPLTDTTELEYEYGGEDEAFLRELDNIAFSQGENMSVAPDVESFVPKTRTRKKKEWSRIELIEEAGEDINPSARHIRSETRKKNTKHPRRNRQVQAMDNKGREETLEDIIGT